MKKNLIALTFLCGLLLIWACKHEPFAAPKTGSTNNGTGTNNPENNDSVSFQTEVLPILLSNCAMSGCHAQNNPQKNIRLNSYSNLINSDVVEAGRPDRSELMEMIEEQDEADRMPPPPAPGLTPAQIALIRKWIMEGARNTNIIRCDTNTFIFSAVNSIITTSCKGCHGPVSPSGGVSLADYAAIKNATESGKIMCAIEHAMGCSPMPQGGAKLEACKITIIKKWASAGYPQ